MLEIMLQLLSLFLHKRNIYFVCHKERKTREKNEGKYLHFYSFRKTLAFLLLKYSSFFIYQILGNYRNMCRQRTNFMFYNVEYVF